MRTKIHGLMAALLLILPSGESRGADLNALVSVNTRDTPIRNVLESIAANAGLKLAMETDPGTTVTMVKSDVPVRQVLDQIGLEHSIEYQVSGDKLIITKRTVQKNAPVMGSARLINVQFAKASEIASQVSSAMGPDDKLIADEQNNNLVYIGTASGYERVLNMVALFDAAPQQVMIEALIVETTNQFLRDIGISSGDLSDRSLTNNTKVTGYASSAGPSVPNLAIKALVGHIDGRALDVRLTAAETSGKAKVVSRPKIVTLNNKRANIESGVSYHVKTLSQVASGNTSNQGTATGGLTTVNAGLTVSILPKIVGTSQVKLEVMINNSQPDEGTSVDGIPGVLTNSANTSVIVRNSQTAVIAGLVKQSKSDSGSGVPILRDIPLIGALFGSRSVSDRNNELVIFITPTIADLDKGLPDEKSGEKAASNLKRVPATAEKEGA
jgi:type IV pilus assembly protein PilQ